MECKELFIFENGQPLTTPPPQVSFWAFRLTVQGDDDLGDDDLGGDDRIDVYLEPLGRLLPTLPVHLSQAERGARH